MEIRAAHADDATGIAAILIPVIREGTTYALDRGMTEAEALAYWCSDEKQVFVAEEAGAILGTYFLRANQAGGGAHVANTGYMTSPAARGRGVARAMCMHSLEQARAQGFRAMQFNFVVSTNVPAVALWQSCGFAIAGTLPGAFRHPELGAVDVYVMFQAF